MNKFNNQNAKVSEDESVYEFCPRCDANLTLQKGYSNNLPFWNCRGCGEMLINPEVDAEDDIAWICDKCGCMLNIQDGFSNDCGEWSCKECGFTNKIDASELYVSEDEFQQSLHNPYKGLSDEDVLKLSIYDEIGYIADREDIILVKNLEDERLYVKKILKDYDISVYRYLKNNPIEYMPRISELYEGSNNLIIIEEFIDGKTLAEILNAGHLNQKKAVNIIIKLCKILQKLHNNEKTIIHRDIKPSNVIISNDDVYLLDINVAKWYKPDEVEDTKMYGTLYYAAPEQFGYGFLASSTKSDVYALGVMLNVMLTGKRPKEEKAKGALWNVIEKCISLEQKERYSVDELILALERV